jgi:aspartate/methionine/tyrosine aminotransferase
MRTLVRDGRAHWGDDFCDLGRSEPPHRITVAPPAINDPALVTYLPPLGLPAARAAAARLLSSSLSDDVYSDVIGLTPGSLAGIAQLLAANLRPGEQVIIPVPFYHAYVAQAKLFGAEVVGCPVDPTSFRLQPAMLRRYLGPNTRMVVLNNPVNPTGVHYRGDELHDLLAAIPPHIFVLCDEAYADYALVATHTSLVDIARSAGRGEWAVTRSASKTLGLPGLRLGITVAHPSILPRIADVAASLTGPANAVAQRLIESIGVDGPKLQIPLGAIASRAARAVAILVAAGFAVRPPEGTYYLWARPPGAEGADGVRTVTRWVRECGVFAWPGEYFGCVGWIRFSLSTSIRILTEGLGRIVAKRQSTEVQ